jgi:hypothetical protein
MPAGGFALCFAQHCLALNQALLGFTPGQYLIIALRHVLTNKVRGYIDQAITLKEFP